MSIVTYNTAENLMKVLSDKMDVWQPNQTNPSCDGSDGRQFEIMFGIKENNRSEPDLVNCELKTLRDGSTTMLSLFCKEPLPKGSSSKVLLCRYSWPFPEDDPHFGENSFYCSVSGKPNARGLSYIYDKPARRIVIEYDPKYVRESSRDNCDSVLSEATSGLAYYDFDLILGLFKKKLNRTLLAISESKKEDGKYFTKFNEAILYEDLNIEAVERMFEEGKVIIDFRLHTRKLEGKYCRNHGTIFRIDRSYIDNIWREKSILYSKK